MKKMQSFLQNLFFTERSIPLVFLIAAILGFGLLSPTLGFYQDDWPYVFYGFNKGIPSLAEELYYDSRPNAAWLYISAFHLLGFKPLGWHIAAILMRWLTATTLWFVFRRLWPGKTLQATFVILLFIIHPFFLIQPYAVNSILYWTGYLLFAISLWLMVRSVTEPTYRLPLTLLAVFLEVVHLFTSEYFVGMVLVRPLILFWLLREQELNLSKRLKKVFTIWLPYLGALALYVLWRLFFYVPSPFGDRNAPVMLYNLISYPFQTIYHLLQVAIQDSVIVTFTSWYKAFVPELFAFDTFFDWIAIIIVIVSLGLGLFYLTKVKVVSRDDSNQKSWISEALILGVSLVILGLLPIWIIGQDIVTHKNQFAGSRFGIGSTLGAASVLTAIIEGLIDNPRKKIAVISTCMALAIGMHLNNEKTFGYSWEKQIRLYQQLTWRAPEIQPGTAIVTDEEILGYMGQYATSFGIITAYQPGNIKTPPYWYFPAYYTYSDFGDFVQGIPIEDGKLSMEFSGQSTDSLVISFNPELDRCLWVMRPEDNKLRLISDDMRKLSEASAIERIGDNNGAERTLPEAIFGKLPQKGWCYYFEKADLARQNGRWDEVTKLYKRAKANGEQAGNGFEYIPFIEGYGHSEDWEMVKSLTKTANRVSKGLEPSLCESLDGLLTKAPKSTERDEMIFNLKNDLDCEDYE
jgi:hypothetical protein